MPELSIIVPIYNGEEYLKKCLDSILAQTYKDFEVILVDDGSRDCSLEICREYEKKDSRVVVFHKENAGLVAARKSGLALAKGEYIGFVDCDDYIDDDMYQALMQTAKKDRADIVVGGILYEYPSRTVVKYNKIPQGFYNREAIEKRVIPKMLAYSGFVNAGMLSGVVVKVFKREVLVKALPKVYDNLRIGEDIAITAYSFMNAESATIVKMAAYHYIQSEGSMIRKTDINRFNHICSLYECLMKVDNADYKSQINQYISRLVFDACVEIVLKSGYKTSKIHKTLRQILRHKISQTVFKNMEMSWLPAKDKIKIFLMRFNMVMTLTFFLRRAAKKQ